MKRLSLTAWIFIGMAVGVLLGIFAPGFAKQLGPLSAIFLRLIRSIVAPLIFATLVAGIAGSGGAKNMGRIGAKAIGNGSGGSDERCVYLVDCGWACAYDPGLGAQAYFRS